MEWISVKDKLPEMPDYTDIAYVLITDGEECGSEAVFHRDGTWSWDNASLEPVEFETAYWMSLPAPPRKGEKK